MATTFVVSDESINSYGTIIKTAGIDFEKFSRNPIMFFMHDREKGVIGRWENIRKESTRLLADAVFDESAELGQRVKKQVDNGFLRSASIGVQIVKKETINGVETITECILTEISIVDIPSNSNALKLYHRIKQRGKEFLALSSDPLISDYEDLREALVDILKLPLDATENDIIKAVSLLISGRGEQEAQQVEAAINAGLISRNEKEEFLTMARISPGVFKSILTSAKSKRERTVEIVIDNAVRERKIAYAQKEVFKRISENVSVEDFTELIAGLAPAIKVTEFIENTDWTLDDYRRYAPEKLRDNPELYEALLKEKKEVKPKKGTLDYYRRYDPEYLKKHPEEYERMVKNLK